MTEEKTLERGFFKKVKRTIGRVPFVPDAVALYFCMRDPITPLWVKSAIAAGLIYFVSPIDAIPDLIGLVGYADDAAVIGTVLATVKNHLTEEHRRKAKAWLNG